MQTMSGGRETKPEVRLRSALWAMGLRYRKDHRPAPSLRARADVVFAGPKVCVFLDGCFWHGCPRHFRRPRTNGRWWASKIARNVERDRRATAALTAAGWHVIRAWEHESPSKVAARVKEAVRAALGRPRASRGLR
jgi:DNA mismatch endonuclease (patch repair protein)